MEYWGTLKTSVVVPSYVQLALRAQYGAVQFPGDWKDGYITLADIKAPICLNCPIKCSMAFQNFSY